MNEEMALMWVFLLFCETVSAAELSIARGKPTGQETTFGNFTSNRAVDGNYARNLFSGGGATTNSNNPWWTVDLGGVYMINNVDIYNRNIMRERLDNLYVEGFVKEDPYFCDTQGNMCGFNQGPSGDIVSLTCPNNTLARFVRIRGPPQMTLIEVDVFGQLRTMNKCDIPIKMTRLPGRKLLTSLVVLDAARNPNDCVTSCFRRGLCSVFNFNVLDGSCVVTTHPVTDEDLTADDNWDVYYAC